MRTIGDLEQKWLDALTSGTYTQAVGCLRTKDKRYCCLGVALNVLDPEGWSESPSTHNYVHSLSRPNGDGYLSNAACTMFGINDLMQAMLAKMNDNGKTFEEIAACLRSHYEGETREVINDSRGDRC